MAVTGKLKFRKANLKITGISGRSLIPMATAKIILYKHKFKWSLIKQQHDDFCLKGIFYKLPE
jgi:hypothetical protein